MEMKNVLLVKYGEIALRGKNRKLIEDKLISVIKKNIDASGICGYSIKKEQGRFLIENEDERFDYEKIIPLVITVLGVVAVCPGIKLEDQSIESLRSASVLHMEEQFGGRSITYKVETRRSDKRYPMDSRAVSADVGGYILHNTEGKRVDVHNPEVVLYIELRNSAYIYSRVISGFGGLPSGISGKALLLLSGGIDSPVAGFMCAKRGVDISAVYFHSPPYTSERAKQKVIDLAERLSVFTGGIRLYIIPFTEIQLHLYEHVQAEKLTILLKRAMLKIAEKIAESNKCHGLITGDSIGQVASQTMHSINAVDSAVRVPVLRPLCGMDKQEIIDLARRIETFDISIRPYEDCCTIFVAKHPETKPKTSVIEGIEKRITKLSEMIDRAVTDAEIIEL